MMKNSRYLFAMRWMMLPLLVVGTLKGTAQDCNSPQVLCGEMPTAVNLTALQPVLYDCIDAPYTLFMEFTTNANTDFTGSVQIDFQAINCSTDNTPDLISALVVEPDQQDYCDESSYVPVSLCTQFAEAHTLSTDDLAPNTRYLLILGTSHEPTTSPCGLTVTLNGNAIGINACCTANLAQGQSAPLQVTGGDPALGYVWSPDYFISTTTGPEVVVAPDVTTTYTVSGFIGACAYSDAVTVTVGNPLEIPNSFTPNDDGFNDRWSIPDLIPYDRARLLVYDRWGQIVFRSTGYPQAWDGTRNGKPVPAGAYYYTIELNDAGLDLPTITGALTVVR